MPTKFQEKVYSLTKKIPRGKVSTYLAISKKLKSSPRAVGNALNKNPYAPIVPCHRVVKTTGEVGGFASGTKNKILILKKESVDIIEGKINLEKFGFNP